jgi:hypothetical protein
MCTFNKTLTNSGHKHKNDHQILMGTNKGYVPLKPVIGDGILGL